STQVQFKPEPEKISPVSDESLLEDKPERQPLRFDPRWAYGAVAIAMLSFVVVKLPGWFKRTIRPGATARDVEQNSAPIDALRPANEGPRAPAAGNGSPLRPRAPVVGTGVRRPPSPVAPPEQRTNEPPPAESSYDSPREDEPPPEEAASEDN